MNSVWDSSTDSWVIYTEGVPKKFRLKLSWNEGVAALIHGGEIRDCTVEVCGGIIRQKKLITPHSSKQVGNYHVRAFPLLEI